VGKLETEVMNQLRKMLRSHIHKAAEEHTPAIRINSDKLTETNS